MIIFDLDGTLADCEHRRHFVDPTKIINPYYGNSDWIKSFSPDDEKFLGYVNVRNPLKFQLDWRAFYDACGDDKPILPVINIFKSFLDSSSVEGCRSECFDIEIWSGRCESVRQKTEKWLVENVWGTPFKLKMRPIGNTEHDEVLKERWLNEYYYSGTGNCPLRWATHDKCCKQIDFVFDSHGPSIEMWKRRGIFVFNCDQG